MKIENKYIYLKIIYIFKIAVNFPIIDQIDAIYYVNTMRLQKKDISRNKEGFLN